MASLQKQVILQSDTELVLVCHLLGDNAGDFADYLLFPFAEYQIQNATLKWYKSNPAGYAALLSWDCNDKPKPILTLPDHPCMDDFCDSFGGIPQKGFVEVPKNGILITTTGLETGDYGTIILGFQKTSTRA